jgi:outer membrane protein OmpA-like peptidoglycan-associated protein
MRDAIRQMSGNKRRSEGLLAMTRTSIHRRGSAAAGVSLRALCVGTALLALSGCSSTPDWANPVEWYRGARDAVVGSDKDESASGGDKGKATKSGSRATPAPGSDKAFPNLASVPERPQGPTEEERDRMAKSLAADRANARYSDEVIRRQSESGTAPASQPATGRAAAQPSPVPPSLSAGSSGSAPASDRTSPTVARAPLPAATPAPVAAPPSVPAPASLPPLPGAMPPVAPLPPIASQPPQFAPPPPSPQMADDSRFVRSLVSRPTPSTRSIARIGNPSFGEPPADIAASLGAGAPPAASGSGFAEPLAMPSGTLAAAGSVEGDKVATIAFAVGSAALDAGDRRQISEIVRSFRQRGGAIRVEGHASSRTKDMQPVQHQLVNFDVSLNRANAVASELIRQGVPAEAVFVAAMSDSQPIYYEVMPAGEAGNQRVEIYFVN